MSPVPELELEKRTFVQRFKITGIVVGALAGMFTFGGMLKAAGIPMPIFTPGEIS